MQSRTNRPFCKGFKLGVQRVGGGVSAEMYKGHGHMPWSSFFSIRALALLLLARESNPIQNVTSLGARSHEQVHIHKNRGDQGHIAAYIWTHMRYYDFHADFGCQP